MEAMAEVHLLTQPQGQRGNEAENPLKLLYVARHIGRQRFYRADIIAQSMTYETSVGNRLLRRSFAC